MTRYRLISKAEISHEIEDQNGDMDEGLRYELVNLIHRTIIRDLSRPEGWDPERAYVSFDALGTTIGFVAIHEVE